MTLWQAILSDYGDSCYTMSFEELADEYDTTPRAIGQAIKALVRRKAFCGHLEYASGEVLEIKMSRKPKKKRAKSGGCGCRH